MQKISVSLLNHEGNLKYAEIGQDARTKIKQIIERADKGEEFEELAKNYDDKEGLVIKYEEQTFDETTVRNDAEMYSKLNAEAKKLSVGQISGILNGANIFSIIKCVDRRTGGYKSFEEVKGNVESIVVEKKYEEMVDRLVREARVEINERIYQYVTSIMHE